MLDLVVRGASNREIAEALVVTDNTVKYHLKNILQKLHLRNRAQVVAYALQHGIDRAVNRAFLPGPCPPARVGRELPLGVGLRSASAAILYGGDGPHQSRTDANVQQG